VAASFGCKCAGFATARSVKLVLSGRRALAKDAGVCLGGTRCHRLILGSGAGPVTGPDGFAWQAALA
jgi:hypothetical protein